MLTGYDFSAFHRIKSEEMWHYYNGSSLTIFLLHQDGTLEKKLIGPNPDNLEEYHFCVPANTWFAARSNSHVSFSLVGCTVAPGFSFEDIELAERAQIIKDFPQHKETIESLTR